MAEYYVPYMLEYGLTIEQIKGNRESSYGELIIWQSCCIAKTNNVSVNIIDRAMEVMTNENNGYYKELKKELNFNNNKYNSIKTKTISNNGRVLSVNGERYQSDSLDIYLNSVLLY